MKNIIITGGELFNKGAMAMTFVAVSELKRRFPEHDIYLLSEMDLQRKPEELEKYAFKFTGWYPIKFAKAQINPILKIACILRNYKEYKTCYELYSNCELMVDISGYALSSDFEEKHISRYLDHIEFAKSFGIPVYLMPQSFGPFDFGMEKSIHMLSRCKKNLKYVKKIFVREKSGMDALLEIGIDNIQFANDLVLCNREVDFSHIFKRFPNFSIPKVDKNSVAIIPNGMTLKVKDQKFIVSLYKAIISEILTYKKMVYILSHSSQDIVFCKIIKDMFFEDDRIILLSQDYSCIEYNELVKNFEYVIASRYHSIIHAYKNSIPCIALGWAEKYSVLLELVGQSDYCFDLRQNIEIESVLKGIEQMNDNFTKEMSTIRSKVEQIQKVNVFDEIKI